MTKNKKGKPKRKFVYLIVFASLMVLFFLSPKHVQRYFLLNFADISDYQKFDKVDVLNGDEVFHYPSLPANCSFNIPEKYVIDAKHVSFDNYLENHESVAFLAIRNDTLIYENYFSGYSETSILTSFSVSKSFVSALVGIAIDEGYIYSTSQSITFFLKELESPEFDKITIEDLLNMQSGIDFNEGYSSPFADMAKYYYGTNLKEYISHLEVKEEPGLNYDYLSVNTLLLAQIVERATNTKIQTYLERKIWKPLGMEVDASWSIDNMEDQTVKAFCCINAIARDFAKFGTLYLNGGKWDGKQIVPEKWVKRSTSIINNSRDSQNYPYTYQWRVLENGCFFAKGILGQYIFVNPSKKLVFVRLGTDYGNIDWADFCLDLSNQL